MKQHQMVMILLLSVMVVLLLGIGYLGMKSEANESRVAELEALLAEKEIALTIAETNNTSLRNDVALLHSEMVNQREKIEELEEILQIRRDMYVQVVVENRGAFFNLNQPSGFTAEMFEETFRRYGGGAMAGFGENYLEMEKEFGINAVAMASLSALETGWGRSAIAQKKNNFFGWRAYDRDPFNSAMSFRNNRHSALHVGSKIRKNYLTEGGRFYTAPNLKGMNRFYATDPYWHVKISNVMSRMVRNAIPPEIGQKLINYQPYQPLHSDSAYSFLRSEVSVGLPIPLM